MKKGGYIYLFAIIILVLLTNLSSAVRLPTIGGDSDAWGLVLNTFLNVSHNETGGLKNIDNTIEGIISLIGNLRIEGAGNFSGTIFINNATNILTWITNVSKNWTLDTFNNWNTTWDESWMFTSVNSTYNIGNLYNITASMIANLSISQTSLGINNLTASQIANLTNWTANVVTGYNTTWTELALIKSVNTTNVISQLYNLTASQIANLSIVGSAFYYNHTLSTYNQYNSIWSGGSNTTVQQFIDMINKTLVIGQLYNLTASMIANLTNWTANVVTGYNTTWTELALIKSVNTTNVISQLYNLTASQIANLSIVGSAFYYNHTLATYNAWNSIWNGGANITSSQIANISVSQLNWTYSLIANTSINSYKGNVNITGNFTVLGSNVIRLPYTAGAISPVCGATDPTTNHSLYTNDTGLYYCNGNSSSWTRIGPG